MAVKRARAARMNARGRGTLKNTMGVKEVVQTCIAFSKTFPELCEKIVTEAKRLSAMHLARNA
eukprot:11200990-Lingulodinium_polyedra.AAC.1